MGLAAAIADVVRQYLPEARAHLLRRVHVDVGDDAPVVAESLDFCFRAIVFGTPYESATLDIHHGAARELAVRELELVDEPEAP
jgi:Zn finger protein HypA/HybF involved in hydrogenase expression